MAIRKLAGIYGEHDKEDHEWLGDCTVYYFNGKNNAEVVTVNEYHSLFSSLNELRLYYVCKDGDTIVKDTNQILFDLAAQTDTEGL